MKPVSNDVFRTLLNSISDFFKLDSTGLRRADVPKRQINRGEGGSIYPMRFQWFS